MNKLVKHFSENLLDEKKPIIMAEIAQNHDGSIGMAHAYIDALADVGVDVVKFQTHIASEESSLNDKFRSKFSFIDETRLEYWRRMEFSEQQWAELKNHADSRNITFLSSPFSIPAVEMLSRIGVEVWKIGSGDVLFEKMFNTIISTKKNCIISSGMSTWQELDKVVKKLNSTDTNYCLMQCTSKYPTPLNEIGLNNLNEMKDRYGCRVGLSDHSGLMSPSLASISRGFSLIEVHATFDKRMFGPDIESSLSISQIGQIVSFAKELHQIDSNPVNKNIMAQNLYSQKILFSRSLALVKDLPAGHILTERDITLKKPGGGFTWDQREKFINKSLSHNTPMNRLLTIEDIL